MSIIETLLENLSTKQEVTLKKFRQRVQDVLRTDHDDFFLLRWLKARDFDIEKSERMLRKSLEWRDNYGTDDILQWDPPDVLKKYWPGGIFGFDKHGHPILWQVSSKFDSVGMMKSVKRSDIIKYHIWRLEKLNWLCREQSKKLGKRISCSVHISDLSGFSLKMVFSPGVTDIMKEVFALTEANYPENLYSSYVINAPGVFAVFFNILRPFLSAETKRKVHICGRNWKERLLTEVADGDELPVYWGGTARDPDDKCTNHINQCETIPPELFIHDKISLNKEQVAEARIASGGELELKFDVSRTGTVLRWMFETEHYDISYGIFFTPETKDTHGKDSRQTIRQVSRVNSQIVTEDGNFTCQQSGTYVFKFDNSYSWVHGKHVYYEVELIPPVRDSIVFRDCSVEADMISECTRL